jgi:hypothetical protein
MEGATSGEATIREEKKVGSGNLQLATDGQIMLKEVEQI